MNTGVFVRIARRVLPTRTEHVWPTAMPTLPPDLIVAGPAEMTMGPTVDIAANGGGLFHRIPALACAPNGDLLIAFDRRPDSADDAPNPNSVVQRRSRDNGRSWESETVIHGGVPGSAKVGYSDPCYLVDNATAEIHNFHVISYDRGFGDSQAGADPTDRNVLHVEVSTSRDNGHTWTHRDITDEITTDSTTTSRFVASGQGIAILHGRYQGRLVAQMTVRNAAGQQAQSIYSDDHGVTWQAGEPVGQMMDENKVVELSDGILMLNSRDANRSGHRKVAYSHDGGETWGVVSLVDDLVDPTNNGQIFRAFPNVHEGCARARVLLFTNSCHATDRVDATLSVSCDDGRTWPTHQLYMPGEVGYTTVVVQADGRLGVAWERNGIHFATLTTGWLDSVCPEPGDAEDADDLGERPHVHPTALPNVGV